MTDASDAGRWARIKTLFAALEDAAADERARLLRESDDDIRDEVAALLQAADEVGDRFDRTPGIEVVATDVLIGQRVGAYRLIREIGRGGMGAVYEAERVDDEYRKRVAIKTVTAGRDSSQMLRRFRRERQLLARLEHRNIAALLDGGVTPQGHPYFVMEYIEGESLTAFSLLHRLPVRERLRLFLQVCAAVQYAHEHLVVHRDLKPGNILVATDGTVKLLDFGIAKLTDTSETHDELLTQTGALLMTAAYASPEQLRGDPASPASDIFSLGVVLYELLAGVRPFTTPRRIDDAEAVTAPSRTRAGDDTTASVDSRRLLRGEVDSIVLKALRSEPERRYRTVQEFGDDIRRYLDGRPVRAQPDTLVYRARKFIRRNSLAVAAATLAVAALIGGTAVSLHQAAQARRERDRAVLEVARTQKVTQFFQNVLSSAKPQQEGRTITVVDAIDHMIPKIDSSFADQPALVAAVKNTLGSTLYDMALYSRARPLVEDALRIQRRIDGARDSREQADAIYNLAGIEQEDGTSARAESLYVRALDMYGRLNIDSAEIYRGINNMALAVIDQGRLEDAVAIYARIAGRLATMMPHDSVFRAVVLANYGTSLAQLGRNREAERWLRESVSLFEHNRGPNDMRVAGALQPLAGVLMFQEKFTEAEAAAKRAWEISRASMGDDNPTSIVALRMLVNVLADAGRCSEALPYARYIVSLRGRTLTDHDASVATALLYAGWCDAELGHVTEGEREAREGLALRQKYFPPNHWAIAAAQSLLGDVLRRKGTPAAPEAERLLRSGYEGLRRELDSTHVRVQQARERLERFEQARR